MAIRFRTIIVIAILLYTTLIPGGYNPGLAQSAEEESEPVNIVIGTNPAARILREDWLDFSGLSLGANLQFGDLIDPGEETVVVLCSDLTEHAVTQLDAVPCSPQMSDRNVLIQGDQALAGWQRGNQEDPLIPYLITPRDTLSLTRQPIIRWNLIPGVLGYSVSVHGEGVNWTQEVTDADVYQLLYPQDAPVLTPGSAYSIEIIALLTEGEQRSSAEEDTTNSFIVMTPDDAETITATIAAIHAAVEDETAVALIDAQYYTQNGLFGEAVEALYTIFDGQSVIECPTEVETNQSPVVYRMLGDLYLQTQLEREAAVAYLCALTVATQTNDLESQALAAEALARLTVDDEKAALVTTALTIWEQLGATERIEALQAEFAPSS